MSFKSYPIVYLCVIFFYFLLNVCSSRKKYLVDSPLWRQPLINRIRTDPIWKLKSFNPFEALKETSSRILLLAGLTSKERMIWCPCSLWTRPLACPPPLPFGLAMSLRLDVCNAKKQEKALFSIAQLNILPFYSAHTNSWNRETGI